MVYKSSKGKKKYQEVWLSWNAPSVSNPCVWKGEKKKERQDFLIAVLEFKKHEKFVP